MPVATPPLAAAAVTAGAGPSDASQPASGADRGGEAVAAMARRRAAQRLRRVLGRAEREARKGGVVGSPPAARRWRLRLSVA